MTLLSFFSFTSEICFLFFLYNLYIIIIKNREKKKRESEKIAFFVSFPNTYTLRLSLEKNMLSWKEELWDAVRVQVYLCEFWDVFKH